MKKWSLHLGLNKVSPLAYNGWEGKLRGCINDATAMEAICKVNGFNTKILLDEAASYMAISLDLLDLSIRTKRGDVVYITYSGHGGSIKDELQLEADGYNETICLFDGQVQDNSLHAMFAKFKKGVNVVFISDSCHAGTNVRTDIVELARYKPIDVIGNVFVGSEKVDTVCNLVGIASCTDIQYSLDGLPHGVFTQNLLNLYRGGVNRSLKAMEKELNKNMPMGQNPMVVKYSGAKSYMKRKMWQ